MKKGHNVIPTRGGLVTRTKNQKTVYFDKKLEWKIPLQFYHWIRLETTQKVWLRKRFPKPHFSLVSDSFYRLKFRPPPDPFHPLLDAKYRQRHPQENTDIAQDSRKPESSAIKTSFRSTSPGGKVAPGSTSGGGPDACRLVPLP